MLNWQPRWVELHFRYIVLKTKKICGGNQHNRRLGSPTANASYEIVSTPSPRKQEADRIRIRRTTTGGDREPKVSPRTQVGFECITKPQREAWTECVVSVCVYNLFRKMHTKLIVKLQTFDLEGAEGRSSREKDKI